MSSTPQKPGQKMCKSPKNSSITYQNSKPDKIIVNEYEHLSTNCTVIGSNNLHLVKKPQILTNASPVYSNPSPGYPPSPYSSPASLKSPSPSLKPPTPQPQSFPVMQIIHNNPLLARPIQTGQQQNIIKLKPHLNILPKPSASPQPSPKPSVSPQIVIPANQQATIMPTAQPLLLNQMPMLTPGVQFILRQQPTKIPTQMSTATATPQGLILQPGGQPLLQLQTPRSQPMVRVLTNGMQLAPPTTTYVTQLANHQAQVVNASSATGNIQTMTPKKKPKKKKQKLDLANIMKLSGIGDEDDIQFESDTSQSESEPNSGHSHPNTPQPQQTVIQQQQTNIVQNAANLVQANDSGKKIGNIQISAVAQPTISATATPLLQVLNQNFQSGMLSNTTTQAAAQGGIPFNPFITPNFTINNGLMLQRSSGGFKLTVGEDGRLVLQHDPTLNQDLQSQLLLQSIFGLNGGGLVLQPSMDQQVHSQTVQTIQQQSVQTIQQQTVQSQTIQTVQQQTVQPQTVQHSLQTIQQTIQPQIQTVQPQTVQQTVQQTIQHQTVQSQPLSTLQGHSQPMQIVQPQPIQNMQPHSVASLHPQQQNVHSIQSQVQSLQSQIQGQIQNLLQSQPIQTIQSQPIHTHTAVSRNIAQPIQTIQTVQAQPMQSPHSIQQQTVHSQPVQNMHTQPVLKVQPFQKSQPPVHAVHPQPIQTIHHHQQQQQHHHENHQAPAPTSYVVNLTPEQLEQLKRNGQLTVNGQTIYMQRPNAGNKIGEHVVSNNENKNKLSPKMKTIKKVNKIQSANVKTILQDNIGIKTLNNIDQAVKESKSSLIAALQTPQKHILPQNHVQIQPQPTIPKQTQPSAVVTPSVQNATSQTHIKMQTQQTEIHPKVQPKGQPQQQKVQVHPNVQNVQTQMHGRPAETNGASQDVERLLGQLLDDNGINNSAPNANIQTVPSANVPQQRVHTIQLTPQKQQHLKSIQLQIQTLSARLTPGDTEMQNALKLLFAEQQKILASGKLLPPAIYHNNQLTIVNPSSLNLQAQQQLKNECVAHTQATVPVQRSVCNDTTAAHQVVTTQSQQTPRITVTVPVNDHHPVLQQQHNLQHANTTQVMGPRLAVPQPQQPAQPTHHQNRFIPSFTKEQLIEQQLNTDQNGAVKPDVHTPFRDKADACKRLIRYHCFDQPVLSEKDLGKADEIFELTAKHFIDKFSRMVDKYRYLLLKESMRQVQTSELMMLDRMFLAEEQQSLIRLRQELEELPPPLHFPPPAVPPQPSTTTPVSTPQNPAPCPSVSQPECMGQEEYDEWACIQRELGCISTEEAPPKANNVALGGQHPPKRSASSDSRLETLKRFRVEKHSKKCIDNVSGSVHHVISSSATSTCVSNSVATTRNMQQMNLQQQQNCVLSQGDTEPENNSIDEQVQSAIDSILNLQQNTSLDLDDAVSSILS